MKIFPILLFCCTVHFLDAQTDATAQLQTAIQAYEDFEKNKYPEDGPPFAEVTVATFQREGDNYQRLLDKVDKIDPAQLDEQGQINWELLRYILQDEADRIALEMYLVPLNAEGGWFSDFAVEASRESLRDSSDVARYLDRLRAFPEYNRQHISLMRAGLDKGKTLPRVLLGNALDMVRPQVVGEVEESVFFQPFEKLPVDISPEAQKKWQAEGRATVGEMVIPAYRELLLFLTDEYLPAANDAIGISAQPGGRQLYEQRVRYFTTLDMTPEQVFATGQAEVARIRREMEAIIEEVGFEGSFAEFLAYLRTDEQFYAKTPTEILTAASYLAKKIDGQLPKYFGKLPRNSYGVQPVPAAIAPSYTSGRYSPGSLAEGRAGNYWVNTTKLESRPLYALPALTLHEAVPGHHLQISLAQEMEGMPAFRRNTYLSAYGEGWALYGEWLGEEMGIYETPYQRFGKLTYEMWRACRLVVDPGIHAMGWTRQQAIDFLAGNTALSIHECTTEIDRYIGWPGQAVSYKIGELKIRELRQMAERELGEKFDLRAFHDLLLSNGSVPLFTLEQMVGGWVEGERARE